MVRLQANCGDVSSRGGVCKQSTGISRPEKERVVAQSSQGQTSGATYITPASCMRFYLRGQANCGRHTMDSAASDVGDGPVARERERVLSGVKNHHELHICSLCVAGRVSSSWSRTKGQWVDLPASGQHNEIVYFLSTLLNTMAKMRVCCPYPNIGSYPIYPNRATGCSIADTRTGVF